MGYCASNNILKTQGTICRNSETVSGNFQRLIFGLFVILLTTRTGFAQIPRLYTTASRHITLPYSVDNKGSTSNVTLLISMNRGKTWKQHAQQGADEKAFRFKAHRDGEFWFCTRTNLQKHVVPLDLKSELRIYIDTKPPQIQLRTERGANSEVLLNCQIADPTISANNVQVQLKASPQSNWETFPLEEKPAFVRPGILQLQGRWLPVIDTRVVQIRVQAEDAAKNQHTEQQQVFLPPLNLRRTENYKPIQNPYTGPVPHEGAIRWPADTGPDLQTSEDIHSVATPAESTATETAANVSTPRLPANVKVYQLNQSQFNLEYNLDDFGATISEVQLWATADGGKTWEQWGVDFDKQSPFEVGIEREGTYGFKTVVTSTDPSSNTPPLPNSAADIWIKLDTTMPNLQPRIASHSIEAGIPEVLIRWTATDDNFGQRPIRLHYQTAKDSTWHEISLAVPNTGIYRWNLAPNSSVDWKVKIEAIDQAGNVAKTIVSLPN